VKVVPFDMVRMQCAYERAVDYDLSGSGIPSPRLDQIIDTEDSEREMLSERQGYPLAGGSPSLKSRIASMYRGASPENVMVTNGATEANFVGAWRLFEKDDEIVIVVPNYLQTWNIAKSWGLKVKPLQLREEGGWQFDPEDLKSIVTGKTKAIQLCNPNNPTGAVLAEEQRKTLLDVARDIGAWILSDEVYIGAEIEGDRTESLWGGYERTLITNGLCKSYALPGLRIGWLVGAPEMLTELTGYRDYLTLTHSMPSDYIARVVLEPERRERILAQNQAFIRESHRNLSDWVGSHESPFTYEPPAAGPMCFARYSASVGSVDFATRLQGERSVLVVPGAQLGMEGYLRIATGVPREYLHAGLDRLSDLLRSESP
jgi:aspartate/methionine/tyrosine aminotransferase